MLSKRFSFFAVLLALSLALTACPAATPEAPSEAPAAEATEEPAAEATEEPAEEPTEEPAEEMPETDRTGAWVDEVVAVEEPSAPSAVTRLGVGELDLYAFAVSDAEVFETVQDSENLEYSQSYGSNTELTFNPAGPVFEGTGELNPFAVPEVREAMNLLIDRNFIAQEHYGGLAVPRYLPITSAFPDYARLIDVVRELELEYAHDPETAEEIITEEMEALGAEMVDGTWNYEGEPVELTILIRTEDERRDIGDYVATLLEDIGFVVTRDYRTSAEASPIWISGDPNEGQFHIYTGGWVTTIIDRDQADNFDFYYTSRGLAFPLWQAYSPSEEFDQLAEDLVNRNFGSLEERREMFAEALRLSLEDSVRIWLVDRLSFSPYRSDIAVSADLAGGINGSWLWSTTIRQLDEAGGTVNIAMPSILPEPWNPLDGSNWIYDQMLVRGTGDLGVLPDPYTGLGWPQRIDRAEVTVQEGLPVEQTLDWVDLSFAETIEVPEDAWVDWDAESQTFITAADKFPDGETAMRKSVVYYPDTLYDLTWHDGSNFSAADVVMNMILTFDRAKEASAVFDPAQVPSLESFLQAFKGMRITSEDPLVVEFYSDQWFLDAEDNVTTLWPYYAQGPGAWHTLGMGLIAEANGDLAYSSDKADQNEIEWMNWIAGPSLEILAGVVEEAAANDTIPYEPTLSEYISADEVASRWDNLMSWYEDKGHFWVGTGALYLEEAFPVEGTVQLRRYPEFPDAADKWDRFAEPMIAEVSLEGPARVTIGEEALFEVFVDFAGEPYPADMINEVKYLIFDASGELAMQGNAEAVGDGLYEVVLSAEETGNLPEGANRIEVAVVPSAVSIPSIDSAEFVTIP